VTAGNGEDKINDSGGVGDQPYGPELPPQGDAKPDLVRGNDKYIEGQTGESAEEIKRNVIGSKNGSKYDLYVDKKTGEVFVLRKGGKGEPQATGLRVPR
jgi:Bacterial toxin 33